MLEGAVDVYTQFTRNEISVICLDTISSFKYLKQYIEHSTHFFYSKVRIKKNILIQMCVIFATAEVFSAEKN